MQRYKLNIKLLSFLVIGFVVFVGSVHLLHGFQVRRNAGSMLKRAKEAMEKDDFRGAANFYGQYAALQPDDLQGQVDYANTMVDLTESGKATFKEMSVTYSLLEMTIRKVPDNDDLRRRMVDFVMKYAPGRLNDAIDHLDLLLQRNPSDKELGVLYVRCLLGTTEHEKAVDLCSIMIGLDRATKDFGTEVPAEVPDSWGEAWKGLWATGTEEEDVYVILALLLQDRLEDPDLAGQVMDQMVKVNPESSKAYVQRATYHQKNKNKDAAKTDIDKALELDPNDADVILLAAQVAVENKEFDAARAHIQRGIEHHESDERMYRTLASVEIAQGNMDKALVHVDRGLERISDSFELLNYKANLQLQEKNIDGTRETIKEMKEKNFPAELRDFVQSRLFMLEGKWIEAQRELERIRPLIMITQNRNNLVPRLDVLLGQCYERLGQNDLALSRYERAWSADATLDSARFGANRLRAQQGIQQAVVSQSNSFQREIDRQMRRPEAQRDWRTVDRQLNELIKVRKIEGAAAEILRAQVLIMQKRFDEARQVLSRARKDYSEEERVLLTAVKLIISEPNGDLNQAIKILNRAEEQFGTTLMIHITRADLIRRFGGDDSQQQLLALEADVDNLSKEDQESFWRFLAAIYHQLQQLDSSRRCLQHVADVKLNDLPVRIKLFDLALANDDEETIQKAQEDILQLVGSKEDSTWQYCEASRLLRNVRLVILQGNQRDDAVLAEAQQLVDQIIDSRPTWHEAHNLQAIIDTLKGQYDKAIENFTLAMDLGPPNPSLAFRLVHLLYAKRRYSEAWSMMQLIPEEQRGIIPGQIVAGIALQMQHVDEALVAAQRVVTQAPNDPEKHLWHARILSLAKRESEVEVAIRKAIELDPTIASAWIALVAYLDQNDRKEEVQDVMRQAQTSIPEDHVTLVMARCHEVIGNGQEAENYYLKAVSKDPNNIALQRTIAAYYLSRYYYSSDGRVKAAPYLESILNTAQQEPERLNLDRMWARREKAKILASTRIYAGVLQALQVINQNAVNGKLLREDAMLKAGILASQSDPFSRRQAITVFEQMKQVKPLTIPQLTVFAQLYYQDGRWPQCREQMLDLLVRDDNNPKILANYCSMLLQRGEIDEANRWLRNLERLDPKSTVTVGLRARVLTKQGNTEQAVALLTALLPDPIERNDKDLVMLGNVAQLLEEMELYEEAERLYRKLASIESRAMLTLAGFLGRHGSIEEAFQAIDNVAPEELPLLVIKVGTDLIRNRRHEVGSRFDDQVQGRLDLLMRDKPNDMAVQINLAIFREVQQNYDDAERLYSDLLKRDDLRGRIRATIENNLAFILALRDKDLEKSAELIDSAITVLGPSSALLDTRAIVRLASGDYSRAITDLNLAVSDGNGAMYYFHLAYAHLAASDKEAARTAFLKAEELGLTPEKIHPYERKRYDQLIQELEITPERRAA